MTTRETFALGKDGKVALWCEGTTAKFEVLNGFWTGRLDSDGSVWSGRSATPVRDVGVIWSGRVPEEIADDHNEAIQWIEEQLT